MCDRIAKSTDRIAGEVSAAAPRHRTRLGGLSKGAEARFAEINEANVILCDHLSAGDGSAAGDLGRQFHPFLECAQFVEAIAQRNRANREDLASCDRLQETNLRRH